jgi:two-component system, cell cycle sensor histidine kinase and response regulator CckA
MDKKKLYIEEKFYELSKFWLGMVLLVGSGLFLLLGVMDYISTPENFGKFIIYRLYVSVSLVILHFISKKISNRIHFLIVFSLAVTISAFSIELMILDFGGHQSTYYVGLIILVVCVFLIPIDIALSLWGISLIYLIYLVPTLLFDNITNYRMFFTSNAFLLSFFVIAAIWRYWNQKSIINELSLQYDLEQQNKQLEQYSAQLKTMVEDRTKELVKSEQWHRSLVDNANDGIVVLDRNGVIINVNDKACEMHGFSREALLGAHVKLLESDIKKEETAERMNRILNGESQVFESVHNKKDGTLIYLEISSKAITIGDELFIQSFYRDITEKKKLQDYLFQSQKMDSIGVLAGGIAHDFNNILTAILGHSAIIRRSALEDKAMHSLSVIEDASRRAGRMISKLLGFARKSNYEFVPLNLNDIVYETVRLLERVIDPKISISVDLDNRLPTIQGDMNHIEQVIMNLTVNARDAMTNGGRIVIKTTAKEITKHMSNVPAYVPPGQYVLLILSDTGTGMPKDVLSRIFEPFYTTKERGKGTGLGLSMVYGTVKEHKGYITVQSELGMGTAFTIYLPAAVSSVRTEVKRPVTSVSGNETILIVDDEHEVLNAMQDTLLSHGYKVFAATDPISALDIVKKRPREINLLITDIVMPVLNGKELISQIKTINSDVKILAISGYTQYVAQTEEIGDINGFLQKPFESYYLLSVVRRILDAQPHDLVKT